MYVLEKTVEKAQVFEAVSVAQKCWCGGMLEDSIHPAYGRCADCDTFVLKRKLSREQLKDFYGFQSYRHNQAAIKKLPPIEQRAVNDLNDRIPVWFRLMVNIIQRYEAVPARLLEIGCAHGGFLNYCRQKGLSNVVGNEPDEQTCRFAREQFNLPCVVSGLFPDITLPIEKFGIVVGFDVLEHFEDPVRALKKVYDLLDDKGFFLFQTPCYRNNDINWNQFKPPEHIFLYDEKNIKRLFELARLEIVESFQGCFVYDMFVYGHKKK